MWPLLTLLVATEACTARCLSDNCILGLTQHSQLPTANRHRSLMLTAAAALPPDDEAAAMEDEPPVALLMLIAGLQSACFGCIGTALPSAMRDAGLSPANVALLLGRIGSASAFAEVLLSASFGKLADAIGRKPILLGAPLVTVCARSFVVVHPSLNVLVGARLLTTLAVPMYWLAYQASMADVFGRNSTRLAILGSRVQAGMGLGYAISSFIGGALAARDIRLAYAASCTLGCCVLASVSLGLRETLAKERRRPFAWKGTSPLAFTRLFGRGALSAKLNAVVLLQSLSNGMGDLWQVLARELRGWGASQCGNFAAIAGLATMGGTLLTGPSIRRFGARGHTVASTMSSACSAVVLGHATSNAIAFSGVVPMALGAGKSQATSARITNLGEELGIPQGQLAAERNTLNAIIKVIAPSLYAWLFALGTQRFGIMGLPFYSTAFLHTCAALVALSIPAALWTSSVDARPSVVRDEARAKTRLQLRARRGE